MTTNVTTAAIALLALAGAVNAQAAQLQQATATFSQTAFGNYLASTMIDGNYSGGVNGWAIFETAINGTRAQTAAFEFRADVTSPALRIQMHQLHTGNLGHLVGRFRFSVTTDPRETFCDGLQTGGDVSAAWTVLAPTSLLVPAGTVWSVLPDNSILIGGNNSGTAVYTGEFPLPLPGLTGLRLEVIEDSSLPGMGPGRYPTNGNFVLTELVTAVPCYADCDVSTGLRVMDIFDFLCFQNRFDAADPYACDCDTSSGPLTCDIFDFLCFQNAYDAGCP